MRRLTTHALVLATAIVAAVSALGLALQVPVFRMLGVPEPVLPLLTEYMTVWFAGVAFLVVPMVANGVLRAGGDARAPMLLMAAAAVINGLLDPVLIFGLGPVPRLELAGAAYATLIARLVTLVGALWLLTRRGLIDWRWPRWGPMLEDWKAVLSVGVPAAITNALGPIATGVMTTLVAREGSSAVAGYGVASRMEGLLLIAPFAISASLTPFIGQNWGAYRRDRVAESLRISTRFVLLWGGAIWLLLLLVRGPLASAFSDDASVIAAASRYLLIVPFSYAAAGLVGVASSSFNAVDRAVRSTALSATRSLLLAVPLAWLGSRVAGLDGLFAGIAAATIVTAVVAARWLRLLTRPDTAPGEPQAAMRCAETSPAAERSRVCAFVDAVTKLEGVEVRPRPIRTVGFYAHGRELGHVHRDGNVDLQLPLAVVERLIENGTASPHRHRDETCWATRQLQHEGDIPAAVELVKLAEVMAGLCQRSPAEVAEALTELPLTPELQQTVRDFVAEYPCSAAGPSTRPSRRGARP